MPSTISRNTRRSARNRRSGSSVNRPQPTTPIHIASANGVGSVMTIEFDQPVSCSGVPAYTTDVAGAHAISAALIGPFQLALTFSAPIAAATEVRCPFEDPCVRNASGGFVATSTYVI